MVSVFHYAEQIVLVTKFGLHLMLFFNL